jgi:hypothetical protein
LVISFKNINYNAYDSFVFKNALQQVFQNHKGKKWRLPYSISICPIDFAETYRT